VPLVAALVAVACAFTGASGAPAQARALGDPVSATLEGELRAVDSLIVTELCTPPRRYAYYTRSGWWKLTGPTGWSAGYHPGALWSGYQLTGDVWFRDAARRRQSPIGTTGFAAGAPNLGALFFPTFAAGHRLTGEGRLRSKALTAAERMAKGFNPAVGALRSRPGGDFNVIIDSLMKSQFLWWAARNGGTPEDAETARSHAATIARDFVRADGSTYHMVYYDPVTGQLTGLGQGSAYSADSTWARGQAWAILGFTAAYRETRDEMFLDVARSVSDWYLGRVPDDMVPYWDFDAPDIPLAPRDSSSAAIAASGLLELSLLDPDGARAQRYETAARATLDSLLSPEYSSFGFDASVLQHGTYLWSSGIVDCGLMFGDAFLLEALLRLRRIDPDEPALPVSDAGASAGAETASAATDGDPLTYWEASGVQTLDLRLASRRRTGAVRVTILGGADRAARLRVFVSEDGTTWEQVRQAVTSGEWAGAETLAFTPRSTRWVRIRCQGTTRGKMNRIAEVAVYPEG
jgi:unsaturated chondroitin disaccharide hydrolase